MATFYTLHEVAVPKVNILLTSIIITSYLCRDACVECIVCCTKALHTSCLCTFDDVCPSNVTIRGPRSATACSASREVVPPVDLVDMYLRVAQKIY